ncbi:uncharacterized protein [Medicago truncatula]|nr:uncharacterized protein LOC120575942 [Medicago truncatula]
MNFFENFDVHDGVGGVGAEDENQPSETASRKWKRSDANSDEEVKDEIVPTSEMESSNFSLHQLFASETASGDEDAYPKKLDSPSKATPMIHKENIKFDKKEEVGSVMSRNKFAKRQPLQDLKQS